MHARFEREARAVAQLDHPHICPVYDVGHQDDVNYLVMQYLEGETLAARLAPHEWSAAAAAGSVDRIPARRYGFDLWALSLQDRKVISLRQTPFNEMHGSLSRDSRWVAYDSDESGRYEVYVQGFPKATDRWTISTEGGSHRRWSANGRELLYLRRDGTLMSVPIETVPSFAVKGSSMPLFKTALTSVDPYRLEFVPSADGKRILMSTPVNDSGDRPAITVVLNWPALLKK